jgi:hypothetical protein
LKKSRAGREAVDILTDSLVGIVDGATAHDAVERVFMQAKPDEAFSSSRQKMTDAYKLPPAF